MKRDPDHRHWYVISRGTVAETWGPLIGAGFAADPNKVEIDEFTTDPVILRAFTDYKLKLL